MSQDFGAKVSQPGYDVGTADASSLYFSSSWPILKLDNSLEGRLTLTGNAAIDIVQHNLGYPPFVMVWSKASGFYPYAIGSINNQQVVFNGVGATVGDTILYRIFRNPINQNFKADRTLASTISQGPINKDYGIRFTKHGKSTTSKDYRDYTIHSGTKSLMVYETLYAQVALAPDSNFPSIYGLKYLNNLPYRPVYFAFYSTDNVNFIPLFAAAQTFPKVDYGADGNPLINAGTTPNGFGSFIILLDPYFTTNQVTVNL